jgi:hypothetical protein
MRKSTNLLALLAVGVTLGLPAAPAGLTDKEADEIGVEAYVYAYPLVLMDATRRVMTNIEAVTPTGRAPMNQFGHRSTFPDAKFIDVVRPNADTLYSALWFDVTGEPLLIRVPDSGGRYYLLQMLDLWTDVFASPGTRTTGHGPQAFVLAGPRWEGKLPPGAELLRSPTGVGWVIGRTQTNGKADYDNVHKFQAGISAVPLSALGRGYEPPKGKVDPSVPRVAPVEQVARMDAATFFARFAELTRDNPPHANDSPVLQRIKRLGLEPGKPFDLARATPQARRALTKAVPAAMKKIIGHVRRAGILVNQWRMLATPVGTYGTDYLRRAGIAYFALGANVSEDSIYPTAFTDADGRPFDSGKKYVLHFPKGQLPPVRAFWSLTMYNDRQLFADNPIDRYAIGDRDRLQFGKDGSLTLYIQRESPGKDREANWLPAPAAGGFSMNLRLFWPRPEALEGTWVPPPVRRVD